VTVHLPGDLGEALELRARYPDVMAIAGGTDLGVHWPQRVVETTADWLDLSGVKELRAHRWTEEALVLGAGTTYWDLIRDPTVAAELPLLVRAARQVGAVQIQARGTWAGNVVNASPAADGVPVLMAYDAVIEMRSCTSTVEVPLSDFYTGYKQMRLGADQLVTWIHIPRRTYDFEWFEKVGSRSAQAITKVGVAVTRRGGEWRVVANSVAPTVCRCRSVESLLAERHRVSGPPDLAVALAEDVSPIDDIRSTARYRSEVLARLLYWGLRDECPFFT
jgi:CO/xanthine dehydrogenase FAD-binding subunit